MIHVLFVDSNKAGDDGMGVVSNARREQTVAAYLSTRQRTEQNQLPGNGVRNIVFVCVCVCVFCV